MPTRWRGRLPRFSWGWECWWPSSAGSRCGWRKTSGWKSWRWRNWPAPGVKRRCLPRRTRRVFPAQRAREQFEKYFVPGFADCCCCWKAAAPGCSGAGLERTGGLGTDRALPALALFAIFALMLFLVGRFSVTMARLENHRLLRPGASFCWPAPIFVFFTALGIAGVKAKFPRGFLVARGLCVLLGLMAVEKLVTLLLEIYRPRVKGRVARPLYDSRIVGLLAQPERLFTTAAQALDYQFGFKVSDTWFFQAAAKRTCRRCCWRSWRCCVVHDALSLWTPGNRRCWNTLASRWRPASWSRARILNCRGRWTKFTASARTNPVLLRRFYARRAERGRTSVVLWTVAHNKEDNFLVGNRAAATATNYNVDTNDRCKAPAVGLIAVSIPVQFQITNVHGLGLPE